MQYHSVTDVVKIPSNMLTEELKSNILVILRNQIGYCTNTYGCILKILSLDEIIDAKICMIDGTNHFKITYTIEAFKPLINVEYSATVYKSYLEGVLVYIENCMSIKALIEPFKCEEGDTIRIILTELQLSDGKFIATGKLC